MGVEIERKFLPRDASWRDAAGAGTRYVQGYLGGDKCSVRVRREGDDARLNIKSLTLGTTRQEFEYAIPVADAEALLASFCAQRVEKIRYFVDYAGKRWEIDEFLGDNAGLVVAEIELEREDEPFARPPWLGDEVTHDPRYYNMNLVKHPYRDW
jgi:adenylate cyclase